MGQQEIPARLMRKYGHACAKAHTKMLFVDISFSLLC